MSSYKQLGGNPDWWRGAVIYQIYPRSFQDSNNDGIGDIKGIISRLDHLVELGVEAIWISPFFTSPMKDFGYDVSNYRDIDPMFGSLEDFDNLVSAAHQRGIRLIIDLVLSHSSDQHPFFKESRLSRNNPRADWYVWAEAKPDGTPPNNWLSIFGGSAWEWDARREQYYLHNFLKEQPDLNFHCPEVQEELLDIVKFWLERGVDGFRLDTINFYIHDKLLRDNPALPLEKRNSSIAPSVNPYNHQEHLYSKNQPENLEFLAKFRKLLDMYPATTCVGEVGDAQRGLEILGEYTRTGKHAHMSYAFEFLSGAKMDAEIANDILHQFVDRTKGGKACWAFSNHDVKRHRSRWHLNETDTKLVASLLLALPGAVCIYQGEEFGFEEARIAFEDLQDPYGKAFWPEFKGRDGCRTPIPWTSEGVNGGFSLVKPWLPVSEDQIVSRQENQSRNDSIFSHYKNIIALRKSEPTLQSGEVESEVVGDNVLKITRMTKDEKMLCFFNFGQGEADLPIAANDGIQVKLGVPVIRNNQLKIAAKEAAFVKLQ